jgi:hypothetical protein
MSRRKKLKAVPGSNFIVWRSSRVRSKLLEQSIGSGFDDLAKLLKAKEQELRGRVPKQVLEDAFGAPTRQEFVADTHVDLSQAAARIRRDYRIPESGVIECTTAVPPSIVAALNYIQAYSGIVPIKQTVPLVLALGLHCNDLRILKLH